MATTESVGLCLLGNVQQPQCVVASIKTNIENCSTLPLHTAQHYRQASRDIQAKQQATCVRPLATSHSIERVEDTISTPLTDMHLVNNGRSVSPCPRSTAASVSVARNGRRSATPTRDPPPPYHMALRYSNSRHQVRSAAIESCTQGSNTSFASETSSSSSTSCVVDSGVENSQNSQDMSLWRHAVRRFGTNSNCPNLAASQLPQPRPPLPPNFKLRSLSDSQPSDNASSPVSSGCTPQNSTAATGTNCVALPVHQAAQRTPVTPSYTCISPLRHFNANDSLNRSTSRSSTKSRSLNGSNDVFQDASFPSARNEFVEHEPPPRLGLSGVLGKSTGKVVLRPTVFKPIVNGGESGNNSFESSTSTGLLRRPASAGAHLINNRNGGSSTLAVDNEMSSSASAAIALDSNHSSSAAASATTASAGVMLEQTERLLRQRDNQLTVLRCTMEQNEKALLQVFEERRRDLERQLQIERQRAAKLEVSVTTTAQRARQAETTCAEMQNLLTERAQELQAALKELRQAQNSSQQHLTRCNQLEISLKEASEALDDAAGELRQLRPSKCDIYTQTTGLPTQEISSSMSELQERLLLQETQFENVQAQWLDEKSKVVAYQKQLQANYLQLSRKAQRLEGEVQRLTNDLEHKEILLKGAKSNSGDSFC